MACAQPPRPGRPACSDPRVGQVVLRSPVQARGVAPRAPARPATRVTRARAAAPAPAPPPPAPPAADVAAAKAALLAAVGRGDAASIASAADRLSSLAGPGPLPPDGSDWATLYTDAAGPSGGRVGPFRGRVSQRFHAGGTYTNSLAFGSLAQLDLSGDWTAVRPDRINVRFLTTSWRVLGGLLTGGSAFEAGKQPRGHWSLLYGDDDVRVFRTNKGSLFVLGRERGG